MPSTLSPPSTLLLWAHAFSSGTLSNKNFLTPVNATTLETVWVGASKSKTAIPPLSFDASVESEPVTI